MLFQSVAIIANVQAIKEKWTMQWSLNLNLDVILGISSWFLASLPNPVITNMTQVTLMTLKCTVPESGEIVTNRKTFAVLSDFSIDKLDSRWRLFYFSIPLLISSSEESPSSPLLPPQIQGPYHVLAPWCLHQKFPVSCFSNILALSAESILIWSPLFSTSSLMHFCIHLGFSLGLLQKLLHFCTPVTWQLPSLPLHILHSPCWCCLSGRLLSHNFFLGAFLTGWLRWI